MFGETMSEKRRTEVSKRVLFVFSDRFMMLWLAMAVCGALSFGSGKLLGVLLCLPAVVLFAIAFVTISVANRGHKKEER